IRRAQQKAKKKIHKMSTNQTYDILKGELFPFENSSTPQPSLQQHISTYSSQSLSQNINVIVIGTLYPLRSPYKP
ncbi:10798_t:CDS:1, partial [Acaulospora colombiana]